MYQSVVRQLAVDAIQLRALSFLDVETTDYAMAMLKVYKRLDMTLATELFDWTYRRSIPRYQAILESFGAPDPFRSKYAHYPRRHSVLPRLRSDSDQGVEGDSSGPG